MLKIPDIHNPRYSYGGGKIISELYGIHFAKKYLKKFIIFRPHNVYGKDVQGEVPSMFFAMVPTCIFAHIYITNKNKKNDYDI
jgi:nucleoside-diphosphate-sugar epimerase